MNVQEVLSKGAALLKMGPALAVGETVHLDAEVLLSHVLQKKREWLFTFPEYVLDPPEKAQFFALVNRRIQGEPVAYITGRKDFWSLSIATSVHTLIPRPETELLVESALQFGTDQPQRVLDLGTGTGAIAIALAKERKAWDITATDSILEVLHVARHNADQNGVCIDFRWSDWFSNIPKHGFDIILSNPPYLAEDDLHWTNDSLKFEPKSALIAGRYGTEALHTIITKAPCYLRKEGALLVEHGGTQGAWVRQCLIENGFKWVVTQKDLSGLDRVTQGVYV